jgi:hypothetical protein
MKKEIIEKEVFYGSFDNPICTREINRLALEKGVTVLDTDIITQDWDDECLKVEVSVTRMKTETDQELEARKKTDEDMKVRMKDYRRKRYLRLKEEFENE